MSTLKVNTVQHNTSGFNNVVQFQDGGGTENGQLARAWVNFNGQGTVATRADFNVNSVDDIGTGTYDVNFTNAMSDANYAMVVSAGRGAGTGGYLGLIPDDTDPTASDCRVRIINTSGGLLDVNICSVAIFR